MDIDTDHKKFHASVPVEPMAPNKKNPPEEADNHQIKWTNTTIYIVAAARRQQSLKSFFTGIRIIDSFNLSGTNLLTIH